MGAVDVVPFIPIRGASMEDCVALSREVGAEIAERFGVPVYLYEESASSEPRRNLAEIRKGQFEGFAEKMRDPRWAPDFGPAQPHPSAGVVAVGARAYLIAYNINLGTADLADRRPDRQGDPPSLRRFSLREGDGGRRSPTAGIVQVSINMTNFRKTPLHRVFECVRSEAARHGVAGRRIGDRGPDAGGCALRRRGALPAAGGVLGRAGPGDEAARGVGAVGRVRRGRPWRWRIRRPPRRPGAAGRARAAWMARANSMCSA